MSVENNTVRNSVEGCIDAVSDLLDREVEGIKRYWGMLTD